MKPIYIILYIFYGGVPPPPQLEYISGNCEGFLLPRLEDDIKKDQFS